MTREAHGLTEELQDYLSDHSEAPTEVQLDLIRTTEELGRASGMQIGRMQGAFMEVLVGALAPRFAVEIGTFTGYSSLSIAKALPADGTLVCCDMSEEWTAIARTHWERAGVADRIDLRIGPAIETLQALGSEQRVDFAFIDADKTGYLSYYEELVPRLSDRGVIAVDNTIWGGAIIDSEDSTDDTMAIRAFNDHVAADPRTTAAMTNIGDGLTLIRLAL